MNERILMSVLAGVVLAACGSSESSSTTPSASAPTFVLAPGFLPDPAVDRGIAGGSIDASSIADGCAGYIASTPDHILRAQSTFSNLRILVSSDADTTLVVRRPDGSFVCSDDDEGLDPIVAGWFPAGDYEIYVGAYHAEDSGRSYRIGISELDHVMPSSLGN